jgi:hypothetical protein
MIVPTTIAEMPPWHFWISLDQLGISRDEARHEIAPERQAQIDARIASAMTALRDAIPPGHDSPLPDCAAFRMRRTN